MRTSIQTGKRYSANHLGGISMRGMSLWYDASDEDNAYMYNGAIPMLNDKSGNGNDTSVLGGSMDGFVDSDAFHRQRVLKGSGYVRTNLTLSNMPTTDVTVFFVNKNSNTSTGSTDFGSVAGSSNRFQAHVPWTDGNVYWDFGNISGGGRLSYSEGSFEFPSVWTMSAESGVGMKIFRNGQLKASNGTTSTYNSAGHNFYIGYQDDGQFAEIIVYNRVLNDYEREAVQRYLNMKWFGLPVLDGLYDRFNWLSEAWFHNDTYTSPVENGDRIMEMYSNFSSENVANYYYNWTAGNCPAYDKNERAIVFDASDTRKIYHIKNTYLQDATFFTVMKGVDSGTYASLWNYGNRDCKFEQWNNTGDVGYTRLGVADYRPSPYVDTPFGDKVVIVFRHNSTADTIEVRVNNGPWGSSNVWSDDGFGLYLFGNNLNAHVYELLHYSRILSDDEVTLTVNSELDTWLTD